MVLCRKFKDLDVPSSLLKYVPDTCAVYVVSSKGRLQAKRAATNKPKCDTSQENHLPPHPHDGSDSEDRYNILNFITIDESSLCNLVLVLNFFCIADHKLVMEAQVQKVLPRTEYLLIDFLTLNR